MIRPSLTCECGHSLWLPYRTAQPAPSGPEWTPNEFLAREIACPECGRTSAYTLRDVRWAKGAEIDPAAGSGNFICWCVETSCNEPLCQLPVEFHWLTEGQSGPEEIRFRTLRLFESGFFKNLLCGRGHAPGTRIPGVRRIG
ncbi:MAG: hypothetical protein WAL32_09235 [Terriglobales bacterium]